MPPIKSYSRILDEHLFALISQGNHEAYLKLIRRYRLYAKHLAQEILEQYQGSGVSYHDVMAVLSNYFCYVVKSYDPQKSSFYSFWKESSEKAVIDYLLDNSYLANAKAFRGFICLDEENDEKRAHVEELHENDQDYINRRMVEELKSILSYHRDSFKKLEYTVLYLLLDGYSINELEHGDIMSRASLYLTFNSACKKLKKIMESSPKNR